MEHPRLLDQHDHHLTHAHANVGSLLQCLHAQHLQRAVGQQAPLPHLRTRLARDTGRQRRIGQVLLARRDRSVLRVSVRLCAPLSARLCAVRADPAAARVHHRLHALHHVARGEDDQEEQQDASRPDPRGRRSATNDRRDQSHDDGRLANSWHQHHGQRLDFAASAVAVCRLLLLHAERPAAVNRHTGRLRRPMAAHLRHILRRVVLPVRAHRGGQRHLLVLLHCVVHRPAARPPAQHPIQVPQHRLRVGNIIAASSFPFFVFRLFLLSCHSICHSEMLLYFDYKLQQQQNYLIFIVKLYR